MCRPWVDYGSTMCRPWIDHGSTMGRPWSAMGRSWIDQASTMCRPGFDHGLTMGRSWVDHGSTTQSHYKAQVCDTGHGGPPRPRTTLRWYGMDRRAILRSRGHRALSAAPPRPRTTLEVVRDGPKSESSVQGAPHTVVRGRPDPVPRGGPKSESSVRGAPRARRGAAQTPPHSWGGPGWTEERFFGPGGDARQARRRPYPAPLLRWYGMDRRVILRSRGAPRAKRGAAQTPHHS